MLLRTGKPALLLVAAAQLLVLMPYSSDAHAQRGDAERDAERQEDAIEKVPPFPSSGRLRDDLVGAGVGTLVQKAALAQSAQPGGRRPENFIHARHFRDRGTASRHRLSSGYRCGRARMV